MGFQIVGKISFQTRYVLHSLEIVEIFGKKFVKSTYKVLNYLVFILFSRIFFK